MRGTARVSLPAAAPPSLATVSGMKDIRGEVREFLTTTPVDYPVFLAPTDLLGLSAALGNGPQGLPFTFILDEGNTIVATKLGQWQEADLTATLSQLLARP